MTFREYIETLYNTHLFGKSKLKFAKRLFDSAIKAGDPELKPNMETIKSWMYKDDRGYNVSRYFPDDLVDEDGFFDYFKKLTKDPGSWKKIQDAFRQLEVNEVFRVDLKTEDPDEILWSLLHQFQRIFELPESPKRKIAIPRDELTPQKIHKEFLEAVNRYNVMEIINKKPAILNRVDLANLNLFLRTVEYLKLDSVPWNDALCASIKSFIKYLWDQTLSLNTAFNHRFDSEDETASVNMEDDEESSVDSEADLNPWGLLTLPEFINAAIDDVVAAAVNKANTAIVEAIPDTIEKAIATAVEKAHTTAGDTDIVDNAISDAIDAINDAIGKGYEDDEDGDDDEYYEDDDDGVDDNYGIDIDYILNLIQLYHFKSWRTFRREINILYDKIRVWQDKT